MRIIGYFGPLSTMTLQLTPLIRQVVYDIERLDGARHEIKLETYEHLKYLGRIKPLEVHVDNKADIGLWIGKKFAETAKLTPPKEGLTLEHGHLLFTTKKMGLEFKEKLLQLLWSQVSEDTQKNRVLSDLFAAVDPFDLRNIFLQYTRVHLKRDKQNIIEFYVYTRGIKGEITTYDRTLAKIRRMSPFAHLVGTREDTQRYKEALVLCGRSPNPLAFETILIMKGKTGNWPTTIDPDQTRLFYNLGEILLWVYCGNNPRIVKQVGSEKIVREITLQTVDVCLQEIFSWPSLLP